MPDYSHICKKCQHEWDDTYSMKQDPPTVCPSCNEEGCVQRLISDNISVRMVMSAREFKENLDSEKKKIKKQIDKDENLKANLVGESKYESYKSESERITKKFGKEMEKLEKKLTTD